ncbi:S8 family serine peptidase [uncultured Tateyamaria sp.]|uniref:S8 family serine peptidase n=1 Tax=uncultured Tateyamaria sp. TaxID=455651 RepID=UPI002630F745|nr:S8 family serine peptidase [uncultured Tateyamaria sp.]
MMPQGKVAKLPWKHHRLCHWLRRTDVVRLLLFFCVFIAACTPAQSPFLTTPDGRRAAVESLDELIVLTAEPPQRLVAAAEALGYVVRAQHPLPELNDTLVVFDIPDGTTIPEAIAEIEAAVPGVAAGANHLYFLQNTTGAGLEYAGPMIGWPSSGCTAQAIVGMIDGGVPKSDTALASGRIIQQDFGGGANTSGTEHGARVAALLVGPGRLAGRPLYSANVVADGEAAGVVPILRGLDWLAANDVRVVNISMAGPRNKLMDRALEQASRNGMVLVAAVGNDGPNAPPLYPAAFPFVIGVTAVDRDGAVFRKAGRGVHVDVAAPGVDVLIRDGKSLRILSGTSMAAPFVTAAIAADQTLTRQSINEIRRSLTAAAADLGTRGHDTIFGAGLLQVQGCG